MFLKAPKVILQCLSCDRVLLLLDTHIYPLDDCVFGAGFRQFENISRIFLLEESQPARCLVYYGCLFKFYSLLLFHHNTLTLETRIQQQKEKESSSAYSYIKKRAGDFDMCTARFAIQNLPLFFRVFIISHLILL